MFIFIAYIDPPELSTNNARSLTDIGIAVEKTLLVNPHCPVRIMLEYIRKKCRLGIFTQFDLCDEAGCLKGLFNLQTYDYATEQFEHKKTYYVIVFNVEPDKRWSVLPQLSHENKIYLDLKSRAKKSSAGGEFPPSAGKSMTMMTASQKFRTIMKKK